MTRKNTVSEDSPLINQRTRFREDIFDCSSTLSRLSWAEGSWLRWWRVCCFTWIFPILSLGYKRTIMYNDLDELPPQDQSSLLLNNLILHNWKAKTMLMVVIQTFWKDFVLSGLFLLPYTLLRLAQPVLLRAIFLLIDDVSKLPSNLYVYIFMYFVCSIVPPFFFQLSTFTITRLGLRVRNSLTALIYSHILSEKTSVLQQMTTAHIVNLISIDAVKFSDSFVYLHFLWEGILEAVIAFGLLYSIVGLLATLCGYGILLLLVPIQLLFSKQMNHYHQTIVKCTDKRLQVFIEFINGSYLIKMYNWEEAFVKKIFSFRQHEMNNIQNVFHLRAFNISLTFALLPLITFITVLIYKYQGFQLNPIDILTGISIYGVIRTPITSFLPIAIEKLVQIRIASKRIDVFIGSKCKSQMIRYFHPTDIRQQRGRIVMRNVSFAWKENDVCLRLLNLDIESGSFMGLIGSVGSGKSSLLAAILGEMRLVHGELFTYENSFSYAPQSAWIFPDTLRANILLGRPFDETRYSDVLRSCCLDFDLITFGSRGDLTMIGEKGVNLSGGQRARVSLARALYIDADVYLIDDILASLDENVAKQIVNRCFGSQGLLRNKTRILVTHQIEYLAESNEIICLMQGHIQSKGSYSEFSNEYIEIDKISHKSDIEDQTTNKKIKLNKRMDLAQTIIEDEIPAQGNIKWSLWKCLFIRSPSDWPKFVLLIILIISAQIFLDSANVLLSILSENSKSCQQQSNALFCIYIGLTLGTLIISYIRADFFFYVFLNGANNLHSKMIHGLANTSLRFYESNPSGRIFNRASRDQHIVDEILPTTTFDCIQSILMSIGSIVVVSVSNPWALPLLIPFIIISCVLLRIYKRSIYQLKRLENIPRSPIYTQCTTTIDGTTTIRALKAQNYFLNTFFKHIDANTRAYIQILGASGWFGLSLDLVTNIFSVVAIILTVFFGNHLSPSLRILLLTYSITMKGYIQWGTRQGIEAQILMTSVERIDEFGQLLPEEDFGELNGVVEAPADWPKRGVIEFQNYFLKYRSTIEPALRNINFRIESKEKIGIIGRTGSGKSSLLRGLLRLVDRSSVCGRILIDDLDISRVKLTQLRSHISIIPQEPILFSGTIRYNLDPLNCYSDEQCWMALEDVQLKQVIFDYPDGLLLDISESSFNLSLGQCQLLCAARAILRRSKIVLIDEATANVDRKNDVLFQKVINEKFQDRTVLTIAHRLSTIYRSDRILKMNQGQIENFDVRENVLPHL